MFLKLFSIIFFIGILSCSDLDKNEKREKEASDLSDKIWDCGEFINEKQTVWPLNDKNGLIEAREKLNSFPYKAIVFLENDNDCFPYWYLQEVENFRLDVQIINKSLMKEKWYQEQLKTKGVPDSLVNSIPHPESSSPEIPQ